jgi:hypothetical protein
LAETQPESGWTSWEKGWRRCGRPRESHEVEKVDIKGSENIEGAKLMCNGKGTHRQEVVHRMYITLNSKGNSTTQVAPLMARRRTTLWKPRWKLRDKKVMSVTEQIDGEKTYIIRNESIGVLSTPHIPLIQENNPI